MVTRLKNLSVRRMQTAIAVVLVGISTVALAATFNLFQPAAGILKGNPSTYVTTAAVSSDVRALWSGTCDASTFLRGDGSCQPSVTGTVPVGNGGTGATTLSGVLKGNGTSPFTSAASSDVRSLWSGTCDASTYLRGDGSCASPGGAGTVTSITAGTGLSASPSSPITSSGTLSVNQAANFSWTGDHTITPATGVALTVNQVANQWGQTISGVSTSNQSFGLNIQAGTTVSDYPLSIQGFSARNFFQVRGDGSLLIGNTTDNPTYNFQGGGALSVGGNAVSNPRINLNGGGGAVAFQLQNAGATKGYFCVSITPGACVTGDATNDVGIMTAGPLRFSTDGGATTAASISGSKVLNVNNANSLTVAGVQVCLADGTNCPAKTAWLYWNASGVKQAGSSNATVAHNSTGNYTVSFTGYSATPACTCTVSNASASVCTASGAFGSSAIQVITNTLGGSLVDTVTSMVCMGT